MCFTAASNILSRRLILLTVTIETDIIEKVINGTELSSRNYGNYDMAWMQHYYY